MEKLFVYGTLRDGLVQQAVLGRMIPGVPDSLDGYGRFEIRLASGVYPMARPQAGNVVDGVVIEVTQDELRQLDIYETGAYQRIRVTVRSGSEVWVYMERG